MGLSWAEHTEEIAATADEVFDAITDYESFPGWLSAVYETQVLERDRKSKLGELVKFEVDGKVRKVRYTLRYSYDRPNEITWDFVEGEGIKRLEGEWQIEDKGGTTAATYKAGIDPGGGVPGPVAKRVQKSTVKKVVEELKAEAERRSGSGESAGASDGPAAATRLASGGDSSPIPFDLLPEPLERVARLPGRIMVGIGKRLGG